jgi:hypothetical protein
MKDGAIELTRNGVPPIVLDGKFTVGGMECITGQLRTRTAKVVRDSWLVSAPGAVWREMVEEDFGVARRIFLTASRMVTELFSRIVNEKLVLERSTMPLDPLPEGSLDLVERLLVLSCAKPFAGAGLQSLTELAECISELRFPNAEAFARPDADLRGHLLLSGAFEAKRVGHQGSVKVLPGAFIPPLWLVQEGAWKIEGEGEIRTLAFRPEEMLDSLEVHFDLVRAVLGSLWVQREWLLSHLEPSEGKVVIH